MADLTWKIIGGKFRKLTLSGSDFENGKKIGKLNKRYIRLVLAHDEKLLTDVKQKNASLIGFLARKMEAKYPDLMQELRGVADGAGADFEDIFLENCPELLKKEDGCTSAAVRNKEGVFLVHNEDEEGWRTIGGFALLQYRRKGLSYTGFAYPGELAGNAFGWNSAGLFYSVNYLATDRINLKGTPRYFVARKLLEQRTLAAAIKHLKSANEASGFHYLIGDTKTGEVVSVEKSLGGVSVRPVENFYFHTNHYIHPKFKSLEKNRSSSSAARFKISKNNLSENIGLKDVLKLFRSKLLRPLNKKDNSKTFATVVFRVLGDKLSK